MIEENKPVKHTLSTSRPENLWWWAILGCVLFLAGFSGPLQAFPTNTQTGNVGSSKYLDFSTSVPLTKSRMMTVGGSETISSYKGALNSDVNSDETNIGESLEYDLNNHVKVTWERGDSSKLLVGSSEAVTFSIPGVTLAAVTQSGANKSTTSMNVVPLGSEGNALQSGEPQGGETTGFLYAITLIVLALLGLVSVARRDVNRLKS